MKKLGKFKFFGLFIFLTVALIFLGINYLEADKPDKPDKPGKPDKGPQWEWTVAIPGSNVPAQENPTKYYNLYGYPDQDGDNIYQVAEEPGRVDVTVEKKKGGKTGETLLRLTIWYSLTVYGDEPDQWAECIPGASKVGFQELDLVNVPHSTEDYYVVPEEFPCFFPNYFIYTGECYPDEPQSVDWLDTDLVTGEAKVPGCMKHFLESYPQPYCDTLCGSYSNCPPNVPNCIYRYVDIMITVDCNIEEIVIGEENSVQPTAQVRVKVVNNFDLQTGLEDWHNISGLLKRDNSEGCITVYRDSNDTWEVTIDGVFTFNEIYKGPWRNRWEYKIPYWTRTPFTFMTTWTRQPVV